MPSTVLGTRNTALMAFTFLAGETGRKHLNILVSQVMIRTKIQGRLRGQSNRGASLHRLVSFMRRHLNRDGKEVQKCATWLSGEEHFK